MEKLYEMFIGVDAVQVEINPLGETNDGRGKCNNNNAGSKHANSLFSPM